MSTPTGRPVLMAAAIRSPECERLVCSPDHGGASSGLPCRPGVQVSAAGRVFSSRAGQDPERAVRDREPLLVALAQECRGAGALAVVEHVPAPGRGIRRQVNWNDPDADQIGHDRTSAIRAARRRTPSSIWSAASALHDSRIAWLPPPSR